MLGFQEAMTEQEAKRPSFNLSKSFQELCLNSLVRIARSSRVSQSPADSLQALSGFSARSGLCASSASCLALSLALSGCQSVSSYTAVSLVRVIDASYNADNPSISVYVEGELFASNIAEGSITTYGSIKPSNDAVVKVTQASNTTPIVTADAALLGGKSQTVLISDLNARYQVAVLEDQSTPAPSGHSEFRVLNQAPSTGAVDVYFLSGTSTAIYATAKPVLTDLGVGATSGYVTIPSSTLFMVIAPAGTAISSGAGTIYTSAAFPLIGGEVRTVLLVDSQLVTQPVQVYVANDVD